MGGRFKQTLQKLVKRRLPIHFTVSPHGPTFMPVLKYSKGHKWSSELLTWTSESSYRSAWRIPWNWNVASRYPGILKLWIKICLFLEEGEEPVVGDQRPREQQDLRREVTYELFATELWSKINTSPRVDYHPTLVWTEIQSFIEVGILCLSFISI